MEVFFLNQIEVEIRFDFTDERIWPKVIEMTLRLGAHGVRTVRLKGV